MSTPSLKDLRQSLGTYQNASAITGVLQLAVDALNLEVATLLRHGGRSCRSMCASRRGQG